MSAVSSESFTTISFDLDTFDPNFSSSHTVIVTLQNTAGKVCTLGMQWLKKSPLKIGDVAQIAPEQRFLWKICNLDTWAPWDPHASYRVQKIQYLVHLSANITGLL
jgi:hypothetical protein